ncbi:hypothetical protein CPC08DRAFT_728383 [Agrocybe pediades]|nr:hypothetical protein CPC08DRAFT_728383 [Agrocybe pediades]
MWRLHLVVVNPLLLSMTILLDYLNRSSKGDERWNGTRKEKECEEQPPTYEITVDKGKYVCLYGGQEKDSETKEGKTDREQGKSGRETVFSLRLPQPIILAVTLA